MRLVLALAALAAGLFAAPASATCMEHVSEPTGTVRVYSCAAPGGPVTTYYCIGDVCWSRTVGEPPN